MPDFGQYYGDMYIGEPEPQGNDKKFSFSTNEYYTVVPSINITDGWYNETNSSQYTKDNLDIKFIDVGVWEGRCQISEDSVMFLEDDDETVYLRDRITDVQFCLVTKDSEPINYGFDGIAGFGKPEFENWD